MQFPPRIAYDYLIYTKDLHKDVHINFGANYFLSGLHSYA